MEAKYVNERRQFIKNRRLALGKTLEEIGEAVGVSKSTVLRWESGNIANMRRDKIAKLADALETTPAVLMGWDDSTLPTPTATASYNITPAEYSLVLAYRQASDADRQIIDNIVERYRPVKKFKTG